LFSELRRRNVTRVGGAYVVVAWLLVQVAGTLEEVLALPAWFDSVTLAALAVGFPVALIVAWAFELTPEGIKVTGPADPGTATGPPAWKDYLLLAVVLAVGALVAFELWQDRGNPVTGPLEFVRVSEEGEDLTIAVMPFVNMSNDPGNAFFADGVSEEILNALTRIEGLRVVARSSSFALRGADITIPEIGQRLRCDLVLEGSVRKAGNTIRVTAQLVETASGNHLWSEVYERTLDDLFGVQDDVTNEIAAALPGLIGIEAPMTRPSRAARPVNPEAYQLYLEALFEDRAAFQEIEEGDREAAQLRVNRSERLIDKALEIDPEMAVAWVLKGNLVFRRLRFERPGDDSYEPTRIARSYLDRALELDPGEASALGVLAQTASRFEWRWQDATTLFERALEADPSNPNLHTNYAYHLSKLGRAAEALEHARIGARLDPAIAWRKAAEPRVLINLGRVDEAAAVMTRLLRERSTNGFFLQDLYLLYLSQADPKGLREMQEIIDSASWRKDTVQAGRRAFWTERITAAIAMLDGDPGPFVAFIDGQLAEHDANVAAGRSVDLRYDDLWVWAFEYARAGESEKAIDLYLRAIEAQVLYIPQQYPLGAEEFTAAVRADARYQAVWREDPRLAELLSLRLEALENRQFAGVLPDGTRVMPVRP
jgi:TolB-like protein/Tfp pilus assembly protein PilF